MRVIETPANVDREQLRDPHAGFIAYVPKGAIAKGRRLATDLACASCHGEGLRGMDSTAPALVHLLLAGNVEQARVWHYRLLPLMDANFLETNPAPAKAALHLMGRIQDVLRLPLVPASEATCIALRSALRQAGVTGV